jgi:violaxanthin de-epoxidase
MQLQLQLQAHSSNNDDDNKNHNNSNSNHNHSNKLSNMLASAVLAMALAISAPPLLPAAASDGAAIAGCLFQKCQVPLLKCIANPKCLLNVICINTCASNPDTETSCQIECGNLFENDVVGEFNKCAVSEMDCVPQKQDDGTYPVPSPDKLVQQFPTSLFNGKWYITAGQNPLFDIFDCQVHFFTSTAPGTFFGKLNWRIEEPDGEFFTRDALQRFVQDPKQPGHMINHDNEYLHYKDDWYILDYAVDGDPDVPPFCLVYYRGSNDAWDGYGGAFVYTRDAKLPPALLPRLREASKKVNFDFDRDFVVTDNSCPIQKDQLVLREKFAGKVALQSEQQVQAAATKFRGNAANSVKAQALFVEQELDQAERAFKELTQLKADFELNQQGQMKGGAGAMEKK